MIDHSQRNRYKLKKNYITNFQNIKIKFNTQKHTKATTQKYQQGRPHSKNRQINKITHVVSAIRDPHRANEKRLYRAGEK